MKRLSIHVTGKVQGVYYRQSTKNRAEVLGLTGFVRNEDDGSVYIEAQGDEEPLSDLITWCHSGPERAQVERVVTADLPTIEEAHFKISRM